MIISAKSNSITRIPTVLTICLMLGAISAPEAVVAQSGTYFGGGAATTERVFREYGADVARGARSAGRQVRDAWEATPNFVKRGAVSSGVGKAARTIGLSVGRSTAIGQGIGFFAFPNCAGEDC